MRFKLCLLSLLTCSAALVFAQPSRLVITMKGSPIGESTLTEGADGSFDSETNLAIGSIVIKSSVKGHLKAGKLTDYVSETSQLGQTATLTYANGILTVKSKQKNATIPVDLKGFAFGGNLHPLLWKSALSAAAKAIAANPATHQTELKVYFLDAGAGLPIKFNQLPDKQISNGSKKSAKQFGVDMGQVAGTFSADDNGNVLAFDVPSQSLRFVKEGWEGIFEDPLKKFPELSQATYKVKTEKGVTMKTRDGVELVCDVVRPDDNEKHPAILVRTPYGRGTETVEGAFYASRGYAFVTQDCRGREDSGGVWDPFVHEGKDGYDTIQWVANQPWCDGKVGMIGGSYVGYVQWAAAVEQPPALKCIVPQVSPPDAMRNIPYDHGTFALYLDLWWAQIVAGKHTDFSGLRTALPHVQAITTMPLSKDDQAVLGKKLAFYQSWLARPKLSDWKGWDFTYHLNKVTIPALDISGVWDGDEIGTHINWNTMRELGRKNQWIIFGPWTHAFNTTHRIGDTEYGQDAIIDLDSVYIRWFDTWLKGKDVGLDKVPHVRLFVTGENKWVNLEDWPSAKMKAATSYLSGASLVGSRRTSQPQSYTYDPSKDNKVPKALITMDPNAGSTGINLKGVKKKHLGLQFATAPFKQDTNICAPIHVNLYFKTSAQDTDFFAAIVDEDEKGKARVAGASGRIRASYLKGMDTIEALKPGKAYELTVTPWDFAHTFKKGHRMVLLIISSEFPIYARNTGYVQSLANGTKMQPQRNTILMDRTHPSSVSYYVLGK